MKFAIITHTAHIVKDRDLYAYSPYMREMNIWNRNVEKVIVVAPVEIARISNIHSKYTHSHIQLIKIPAISFTSFTRKIRSILLLPLIVSKIYKAMKLADHIHLRCPGNIGLLGCLVQVFFPKKPKTVKYAGNWDPVSKQPMSYRFQKWLLSNTFLTQNVKVLVYGKWPKQSKNIISFFTASFSEAEQSVLEKKFKPVFKFLFVGALVEGKNPLLAIKFIEKLVIKVIPVKLEIYGDGILRKKLEEYVKFKDLNPFVTFNGNQNLEGVIEAYKNSHFLILFSQSEGWPKAVAEAMFFGCIPISTSVSCVAWMLAYGERGIILNPATFAAEDEEQQWLEMTASKVQNLTEDVQIMKEMSINAQGWSRQYTLEKFEEAIKHVLTSKNNIIKKAPLPSVEVEK